MAAGRFRQAAKTYNDNAIVQKEMAQKLISLVLRHNNKYLSILEIGAGTGFLTKEIIENFDYENLYINDMEENQTPFKQGLTYLKGDIEKIEIPKNLNLVISSSALQWMSDIKGLIRKVRLSSGPGTLFAFSTFGTRNFEQFKEKGLKYFQMSEIEAFFGDWEIIHLEEEIKTLYFEEPINILKHIKATGVTRFDGGMWTKSGFETFKEDYEKLFKDPNGVELTYHPVFCVAKLPD